MCMYMHLHKHAQVCIQVYILYIIFCYVKLCDVICYGYVNVICYVMCYLGWSYSEFGE
jgi:hypothetical protein